MKGGGRDHWSRAYSVMLAGGGVARGKVVGKTDRIAGDVSERPVSPKDILATAYHLLGIDPETHTHRSPRPHLAAGARGQSADRRAGVAACNSVVITQTNFPPSPPVLRGRGVGGEGVERCPVAARPLPPTPLPLSTGGEGGKRGSVMTTLRSPNQRAGRRPTVPPGRSTSVGGSKTWTTTSP